MDIISPQNQAAAGLSRDRAIPVHRRRAGSFPFRES